MRRAGRLRTPPGARFRSTAACSIGPSRNASRPPCEESRRRLVEAAPVAILTYAGWRCSYANPRAVRLLGGNSVNDLLGRHIRELVEDKAFETMQRDLAAGPRG